MSIKEMYNEVRDEQENGIPAWKLHLQLSYAKLEITRLKDEKEKLEAKYLKLCQKMVESGLNI